ncbi:hypothetical protein K438DRAFT_1753841 [Mycena galopus ATCC 62051]|nr:hypothetical protein K438DRAFT_1753841 [Mycena galopus ATCC 62051]
MPNCTEQLRSGRYDNSRMAFFTTHPLHTLPAFIRPTNLNLYCGLSILLAHLKLSSRISLARAHPPSLPTAAVTPYYLSPKHGNRNTSRFNFLAVDLGNRHYVSPGQMEQRRGSNKQFCISYNGITATATIVDEPEGCGDLALEFSWVVGSKMIILWASITAATHSALAAPPTLPPPPRAQPPRLSKKLPHHHAHNHLDYHALVRSSGDRGPRGLIFCAEKSLSCLLFSHRIPSFL